MKCLSLQGLTVQTRFLHLLSKEWDNCSQFLPVDYGDLGDSPGVRCPPEILSACLDGYLSDVRDVSIQVNKTFKGLVVQKQLPAPVQLSDWGRTLNGGRLFAAGHTGNWRRNQGGGVPLLAKSHDAPDSEGSPELRLRVYRCLLLPCLAEGTAYIGGYHLLLAGSQELQRQTGGGHSWGSC